MSRDRPRIGVLLGDPSGVGPELGVKLLARPQNFRLADVVMLTDQSMLALGEKAAGTTLPHEICRSLDDTSTAAGRPIMVPLSLIEPQDIVIGEATIASGRAVLDGISSAMEAIKSGHLDGL